MNKLLSFLMLLMIAGYGSLLSQKVNCKLKGSDTCLPLSQQFAEAFSKKYTGSSISVTGGGSGVGISSLLSATTDIAQTSRELKVDEKLKLQQKEGGFKEVIIAYDALAVIVNPSNKVSKLTREQLEAIFTGKISNWKEVGGDDLKIIVYSRESSSGTYEFFKEHVLNKKNFAQSVLLMPATGAIIQSVSQTKGAIGYVGLAYVNNSVKPIEVSYDKGKNYYKPNLENAKNKTYPIFRPLYYFYLKNNENKFKPFINFVLSAEGQKIVKEVGYIPVN